MLLFFGLLLFYSVPDRVIFVEVELAVDMRDYGRDDTDTWREGVQRICEPRKLTSGAF